MEEEEEEEANLDRHPLRDEEVRSTCTVDE
jgi:hypothetical protein